MLRLRRGDPVVYNGQVYWIVDGPTNATVGPIYKISVVPPLERIRESELQECPAGYEEAALRALRGS